ncbi:FeoA family protein [Natranaerobius thermophilus]|uniref:FeoA family protein n=1 Tax=Natranaerobius thermophilus TaxID=375929 RepID=UPI000166470E|nr:FeoA family protein [Natranaerobius thermophilus]
MAVYIEGYLQDSQTNSYQHKSVDQLLKEEEGIIMETPGDTLLASLGLRKGKKVTVKAKQVCNGPVICSVDGRNIALSRDIACNILVNCNR